VQAQWLEMSDGSWTNMGNVNAVFVDEDGTLRLESIGEHDLSVGQQRGIGGPADVALMQEYLAQVGFKPHKRPHAAKRPQWIALHDGVWINMGNVNAVRRGQREELYVEFIGEHGKPTEEQRVILDRTDTKRVAIYLEQVAFKTDGPPGIVFEPVGAEA